MAVNSVNSQTPALQTFQTQQRQPAAQQFQQPAAQQNDPIAKLNDALAALEQALQALSFGGGQNFGAQNVGQNLGFSDQSAGNTQQFGFNDQLFRGNSQFDAQPQPQFNNFGFWEGPAVQQQPAPQQNFLDARGSGGGDSGNNGNHFGFDRKSGGGGTRVDPDGANN